jgi:RNA polymerase sigma-54 factor
MKLSFNLKLSQSLKLTPLLQQSIKLLQASQVEINDLINDYINENPFLEYEDNLSISKPRNQYTKNYNANENQDDFYDIFENQTKNLTLKEFLIENSGVFSMSEREQLVFYYLIDAINDDGYLITDFHDLIIDIPISPKISSFELEAALKIIQACSHPGIGSRNLSECLTLQLENIKDTKNITKIAQIITKDYLNYIPANKVSELSRKIRASEDEIQTAIKLIKSLNPRPGQIFKAIEKNDFINHDLEVINKNNQWEIFLNDEEFLKLKIVNHYDELLQKENSLKDKFQEARWLVKNLEQRSITILRVSKEIMSYQVNFLDNGEEFIKPLKLKDIAEKLELHESTISRVTNNKFIKTPHGLFELKFFFSKAVASTEKDGTSSKSILAKIRYIVNNEDKKKPYSDEKIVLLLKQEGIVVARRTIAKYRDILNIAPSNQRKG